MDRPELGAPNVKICYKSLISEHRQDLCQDWSVLIIPWLSSGNNIRRLILKGLLTPASSDKELDN